MSYKNKKSERGFSLVEVLVVTGLMAILSAAMMTMVSDQNKANKATQLTIEANDIYNRVQRYMLDSKTCGETLNGLNIAPGGKRALTNIVKDGTTLISTGNKIGGLTIKSMELTRKTTNPLEFDFMLILERVNKTNSIGSDTFARPMVLQAKFGVSPLPINQVIGCFSQLESAVDTAVQESCDSLCPNIPATVPSSCWNVVTKKCSMPAPATAKNLYMSSTGLTLSQPTAQGFGCSNCGSDCSPCPAGWTELSNNCSRGSQCGLRKWRNCNGTCINGSAAAVGKVFAP